MSLRDPKSKVVIVPGNGDGDVTLANWYGWLQRQLKQAGIPANLENMPDPITAREEVWLPFIVESLGADEHTVLVGHSSGAEAAMRLLEKQRLAGAVLVAACWTDLGSANERASGYYSRPWQWNLIRRNAGWIQQYASGDDWAIPLEEHHHVRDSLRAATAEPPVPGAGEPAEYAYEELEGRGHFCDARFPELLALLKRRLLQ
eukprot:tig00001071_g6807.t1